MQPVFESDFRSAASSVLPLGKHSPECVPPLGKHSPDSAPPLGKHFPESVPPLGKHSPESVPPLGKHSPQSVPPLGKHPPASDPPAGQHLSASSIQDILRLVSCSKCPSARRHYAAKCSLHGQTPSPTPLLLQAVQQFSIFPQRGERGSDYHKPAICTRSPGSPRGGGGGIQLLFGNNGGGAITQAPFN